MKGLSEILRECPLPKVPLLSVGVETDPETKLYPPWPLWPHL